MMTLENGYSTDHNAVCHRKRYHKNKEHRLKKLADMSAKRSTLAKRIVHHLAMGRDVGDIAVRERAKVSLVLATIERLKNEQPNTTQP